MNAEHHVYTGWFVQPDGERAEIHMLATADEAVDQVESYIKSLVGDPDFENHTGEWAKDTERGVETVPMPVMEWDTDKSNVKVMLDEEYGYRTWIWHTGMTEEELVAWYGNLESVEPFFYNPDGTLPGTVTAVSWYGYAAGDDAKGCYTFDPATLERDEDGEQRGDMVFLKWPEGGRWSMHLHCDDDSLLSHTTKGSLFHKGYDGGERKFDA